ncbi:MAG: FtsX-like permease family protein [Cyclobacteriaceae bacterium]|nr:FtsX-like permease family protein [Cyclobacteriaceae bacterium]
MKQTLRQPPGLLWIGRTAWRDARHQKRRLILMLSALVSGVAAMVLLDLLNTGLQRQINDNARELLGADMVVNASRLPEPELQKIFDSLPNPKAQEADMASMVMFMRDKSVRLIRLVAYSEAFPFYGELETIPENARATLLEKGNALIDESLATQFKVNPGDTIKLGQALFRITGVVKKLPGGGGVMSTLTPSVYISFADLEATRLIQFGSRVDYRIYFKAENDKEAERLKSFLQPVVRKYGHGFDDVAERKRELGRAFESVYRFFSLLAFVALVLGGVGIAASAHVYATEKRQDVAILRCMGVSGQAAFFIYFLQFLVLGLLGSVAGVVIGTGLYQLTPVLLNDLLPVELKLTISWNSVARGLLLGLMLAAVFAAWPLMAVRFVPPLAALRPDFIPARVRSKARLLVRAAVFLFPFVLAWSQTRNVITALAFTAGLGVALLFLALTAQLLLFALRKYFPHRVPFMWRHALAGLYRPNNQTRLLTVTLGISAFLLCTLNVTEESLLSQAEFTGNSNQSNTVLFDIQPNQREGVVKLLAANNLPVHQLVPIVTCRIRELKGRPVGDWQKDTVNRIPNWALMREYRVTYRDSLHISETLVNGELQRYKSGMKDSVWVTISEGMHETLRLGLNDSLVMDVQGVPVKVRISGIRKVEWQKDPPNFIFVFPNGVLERAPQIFVAATRINDAQAAGSFQQQLMELYPNVSFIDLRLVLSTINELFDQVGGIIRILALFSLVAGLIVLSGMILSTRFVRQRENALLRTLGSSSHFITGITLIEYGYLGLLSVLAGAILSVGGGYALAVFFFDFQFAFRPGELVTVALSMVLLTVLVGWLNSRAVLNTPPLEVLRKET